MVDTYDAFKDLDSSQKLTLCIMEGSSQLVGWEVSSGSVYQLTSFDVQIITAIEDSGAAYTEVFTLAEVGPGKYFNDRAANTLYLESSDSSDPNTRFLVLTRDYFFGTQPAYLPFDLATGEIVFYEPLLQTTSQFGVQLDNRNQLGFALEGSGSVTFINDADSTDTNQFWRTNFAVIFFENKNVRIYSWGLDTNKEGLPASEAKLLFRGKVKGKKYSDRNVSFTVQDRLGELRGEVQLPNMEDVAGARVRDSLLEAKQRRIYGRVFGHRPTNIDEVLDGYPVTGTVDVTNGSPTVIGTGSIFLTEISPDDKLIITGQEFTVKSVETDLALTLSEDASIGAQTGVSITIEPDLPKNYINREWFVAGHSLREPTTTVTNATSLNFFEVADTSDIMAGDKIFVGPPSTGELVTVQRVSTTFIKTEETLLLAPSVGTSVTRPAVQDLKINDTTLVYNRDFTLDATNAKISLDTLAEFNAAPIRALNGTVTFTDTSRTVTGTSTTFDVQLQSGMWIRSEGEANFFEILSIEGPESLTLRSASTYTDVDAGQYKPVINFDPGTDVLSGDFLGLTEDGTKDGAFLQKGAEIVEHLILDAGITDIDTASFTESTNLAEASLGLVVPRKFTAKKTSKYRALINEINVSIFGSLIQNQDFQLEYNILSPKRDVTVRQMREVDVVSFSINSTNEFMAKEVIIDYEHREFDTIALEESFKSESDTSDIAEFILKTDRTTRKETLIAFTKGATIYARRWRHVLEIGQTEVVLNTKLATSDLQVNDRLDLNHSKLFERIGGGQRKVSAIQGIKKSGDRVQVKLEDLADAFNKDGVITANDANSFDVSTETQKINQGYITDDNGMIDNDNETHRLHRIW